MLVQIGRHLQGQAARPCPEAPTGVQASSCRDGHEWCPRALSVWCQLLLQCSFGACEPDCEGPCGIGGSITDAHMVPEQGGNHSSSGAWLPAHSARTCASSVQAAWDNHLGAQNLGEIMLHYDENSMVHVEESTLMTSQLKVCQFPWRPS